MLFESANECSVKVVRGHWAIDCLQAPRLIERFFGYQSAADNLWVSGSHLA